MLVTQCWRQFLDVDDVFWMLLPDAYVKRKWILVTNMAKAVTIISELSVFTYHQNFSSPTFVTNIDLINMRYFLTLHLLYSLIISQIKKSKNGIDFVTCVSTICAVFGTGTGYVFFQWNFSRLLIPTRTRPEFGLFGVK